MPNSAKPAEGAAPASSAPRSAAPTATLYSVLGVAPSSSTAEITAAYRRLALVYHPDRPEGSTEKFQELQSAHEVLTKPNTRAQYDDLLKGKPALKGFKRPPKMESVEKPVYTLLADLGFYEFEASASKLRCAFHYGDGIEFSGERGSWIGLAGDGFVYWRVNGRGYATQLCKANSDMALSNVHLVYRSNMGLRRKPLERSHAGNPAPQPTQTPRTANRASVTSAQNGSGAGGRVSETERLREQLRNRERHRNATKRLETIKQDEAEERDYLERRLWEQFLMFHTNVDASMRCVENGHPVPVEMAHFMGYMSPEEVPLRGSGLCSPPITTGNNSPQAAALWVDPLDCDLDHDTQPGEGDNADPTDDDNDDGHDAGGHHPSSSTSTRSMSDSSSDADSVRGGRPAIAATQTFNNTTHTAPYSSVQPTGSSPMIPAALRPVQSSTSSLGALAHSPGQQVHHRTGSGVSSPGIYTLPAATIAAQNAGASPRAGKTPQPMASPAAPPIIATGHTTVQDTTSSPKPTAHLTVPSREEAPLSRGGHSQRDSMLSRAGAGGEPLSWADGPPSLPGAAPLRSTYSAQGNAALSQADEESAAERFLSMVQASGSASAGAVGSSLEVGGARGAADRNTTPRHQLYPWSGESGSQRESQTRCVLYEAIPDSSAAGQRHSPSLTPAASPERNASGSGASPRACSTATPSPAAAAASSSPAGRGSPALAPQPTRQTTAVFTPVSTSAAAAPAPAQDRASKTSPPHDEPASDGTAAAAAMHKRHSHSSGEGAHRQVISKSRPSSGLSGEAARMSQAPEKDASCSPRPVVPAASYASRYPAGPAVASGGSVAAHSLSRGDSAEGSPPCGLLSGPVDHSIEMPPQNSDHSSPNVSRAATTGDVQHSTTSPSHQHYSDPAAEAAVLSVPSASLATHDTAATTAFIHRDSNAESPAEVSAGNAESQQRSGSALVTPAAALATPSDPRVTMAPLRLSTSLERGLQQASPDGEGGDSALLASGDEAAKKKRSRGRVTPRYMLSTEAHARRTSYISAESPRLGGASPRLDATHDYSSKTVEEMFAEEMDFMNSFSKTKRAV